MLSKQICELQDSENADSLNWHLLLHNCSEIFWYSQEKYLVRKVVLHPKKKTTLVNRQNLEKVIPHATVPTHLPQYLKGLAWYHFIFKNWEFYYLPLLSFQQSGNSIWITGSQIISLLSTLNLHQRL